MLSFLGSAIIECKLVEYIHAGYSIRTWAETVGPDHWKGIVENE
jgi:hypothetical protein